MKRMIAGLLSSVMMVATAQAAVVVSIKGTATVNAGTGFKPLGVGAQLKPGDRVTAGPDGTIEISYTTGATSTVTAGQVFTVPVFPPGSTPLAAVAPPVVVVVPLPVISPVVLIAGGVATVVGGTMLVTANEQENLNPPLDQ